MILFSHARSALKYALTQLKLDSDTTVMVPDYNCQAIYQPFNELNIPYNFYSINENFQPDWTELRNKITKKTKALLMVHYFGQPADINKYIKFSKEYNLYLLEDNSHGFSGKYNGQELGTFGDIGISSPRKILNLNSGGVLYFKNRDFLTNKLQINRHPRNFIREIFYTTISDPKRREILKKYLLQKPDFSDPSFIKEYVVKHISLPDLRSEKIILNANWLNISQKRRESWKKWSLFAKENNLHTIYDHPKKDTCPWIVPFYTDSKKTRDYFLNKSWRQGLGFMSWPTLPDEVIKNNKKALQMWEKIICINLDHSIDFIR